MEVDPCLKGLGDLEKLPVDVLVRVFSDLQPAELAVAEAACRAFRGLVVKHLLWKQLASRESKDLVALVGSLVSQETSAEARSSLCDDDEAQANVTDAHGEECSACGPPAIGCSNTWKMLCYRLTAPNARDSLLAEPLLASSTDNAEETVENIAWPLKNRRVGQIWPGVARYWSSKGSDDVSSDEHLLLRLAHPACLIREVHVQAFRAEFQQGHPIYSPQRVSFSAGNVICFDGHGQPQPRERVVAAAASSRKRASTTPQMTFAKDSTLQPFVLSTPLPCFGGLFQVNLHGRTQRQAMDDRWYTCIAHLRVVGTPIYNFLPRSLLPRSGPAAQLPGVSGCGSPVPLSTGDADDGASSPEDKSNDDADVSVEMAEEHAMLAVPGEQLRQVQLQMVKQDPLEAAGGLHAVSECGRHVTGAKHPHAMIIQDLVAMHAQQQQVPEHLNQAFQAHLAQQLHNALNADEGSDEEALQEAYDAYLPDAGQQ